VAVEQFPDFFRRRQRLLFRAPLLNRLGPQRADALYQAVDVEAFNKKLGGYKGNEFWWMNQTADWYINS